jgi:colanic acid/amylovoran biosynthesis glycosyltransferase
MVDSFPTLSETFVLEQIDALLSQDVDVRVVARTRSGDGLIHEKGRRLMAIASFAEDGAPFPKYLPRPLRHRYPQWLQRRLYAQALGSADLVICHFGPIGRRAAMALETLRTPSLWTIFHGHDISTYVDTAGPDIYAKLFARGDRFFGVSRLWTAKLEKLGCPPSRIGLLRMGVDVDRIPFVERRFDPQRELRILSVCRLVEKKGMEFSLLALAELRRRCPELNWSYEIVGEGPLRHSLESLSRSLGLHESVVFSGRLPAEAVRARLGQCDLFMLPSVTARDGDMEGIPVSLMEAMAAGVPVLSTSHSGIPELVEDGVNGLLAPERDHLALADNLLKLIDRPDLGPSLAAAARRKIEAEFNQRKISEHLASEISKELAQREAIRPSFRAAAATPRSQTGRQRAR